MKVCEVRILFNVSLLFYLFENIDFCYLGDEFKMCFDIFYSEFVILGFVNC